MFWADLSLVTLLVVRTPGEAGDQVKILHPIPNTNNVPRFQFPSLVSYRDNHWVAMDALTDLITPVEGVCCLALLIYTSIHKSKKHHLFVIAYKQTVKLEVEDDHMVRETE